MVHVFPIYFCLLYESPNYSETAKIQEKNKNKNFLVKTMKIFTNENNKRKK